jgi:hypothetical protein
MPIELYRALAILGLVAVSSWGCWKCEELKGLHPTAKLGLQAGVVALAGLAGARLLGLL